MTVTLYFKALSIFIGFLGLLSVVELFYYLKKDKGIFKKGTLAIGLTLLAAGLYLNWPNLPAFFRFPTIMVLFWIIIIPPYTSSLGGKNIVLSLIQFFMMLLFWVDAILIFTALLPVMDKLLPADINHIIKLHFHNSSR